MRSGPELNSLDDRHLKFKKLRVGPGPVVESMHTMSKVPGPNPSTRGKTQST